MASDPYTRQQAPAVERTLAIIEQIARSSSALSFGELQHRLQMPRSTLIRFLAVLHRQGWVQRDRSGYRPGKRLVLLRSPLSQAEVLRMAAHQILRRLADETGNTAVLFHCEDGCQIVLAKHVHPAAVVMRPVGAVHAIAWDGPWDWVVSAAMTHAERERLYRRQPPAAAVYAAAQRGWRDLVRCGWVLDDQVCLPLLRRMAVPIRQPGEVVPLGVLALGGNPLTMPDARLAGLGEQLSAAASQIVRRLVVL